MKPQVIDKEAAGARLKAAREAKGLGQRELALRAARHLRDGRGSSYAYISRIEAGKRGPSWQVLEALALELDVDPHWIASGEARIVVEVTTEAVEAQMVAWTLEDGSDELRLADLTDEERTQLRVSLEEAVIHAAGGVALALKTNRRLRLEAEQRLADDRAPLQRGRRGARRRLAREADRRPRDGGGGEAEHPPEGGARAPLRRAVGERRGMAARAATGAATRPELQAALLWSRDQPRPQDQRRMNAAERARRARLLQATGGDEELVERLMREVARAERRSRQRSPSAG